MNFADEKYLSSVMHEVDEKYLSDEERRQMIALKVCPLPCNQLAFTNCVYISENDAKLFQAPTYIKIHGSDAVFVAHANSFVVDGEIAMSGPQRNTVFETHRLKLGDIVHVDEAVPTDFTFLKHVCFKISCNSRRNVIVSKEEIIETLKNSFVSHILYPRLELPFLMKNKLFSATIEDLDNPGILAKDMTRIKINISSDDDYKTWYEFNPVKAN